MKVAITVPVPRVRRLGDFEGSLGSRRKHRLCAYGKVSEWHASLRPRPESRSRQADSAMGGTVISASDFTLK